MSCLIHQLFRSRSSSKISINVKARKLCQQSIKVVSTNHEDLSTNHRKPGCNSMSKYIHQYVIFHFYQHCTSPYFTVTYRTTPYFTVPHLASTYFTVLHRTSPNLTVLHSTSPYLTVHHGVLHCTRPVFHWIFAVVFMTNFPIYMSRNVISKYSTLFFFSRNCHWKLIMRQLNKHSELLAFVISSCLDSLWHYDLFTQMKTDLTNRLNVFPLAYLTLNLFL